MCEQGETSTATVLTKDGTYAEVQVDRCLSDLVTALNQAGFMTESCCCGHGDQSAFFIAIAPDCCFFGWRGDGGRADLWCGLVRKGSPHDTEPPIPVGQRASRNDW